MGKLQNFITLFIGTAGGILAYFLGGFDGLILTLIWFTVVDYITGVIAGIYNKELSSYKGFKGILKKLGIYLVVSISVFLERHMGIPAIREMVITFFIANEGISILENLTEMGVEFPNALKNMLLEMQESKKSTNELEE